MLFSAAIRAAAARAPRATLDAFEAARPHLAAKGALANAFRAAHLIGQCAHESGGFVRTTEALHYRTGARIFAVFGRRHFSGVAEADPFARDAEKLANHVYASRMGNGDSASGDGYRYRGRGYLQLTGRANYRTFGRRIGVDLEARPDLAAEPEVAWRIAACYFATRSRAGRTALEWADADNVEMVTRIVNGGVAGLDERRHLTALALAALEGTREHPMLHRGSEGSAVLRLQHLLTRAGFVLGALDGDFGPRTQQALRAFQGSAGLPVTGATDRATWTELQAQAQFGSSDRAARDEPVFS